MNKPYFTKWLPVEGEIKESDEYITNCGNRYKADSETIESYREMLETDKETTLANFRLAKLFLCSRDIQVGDKVNGNHIIKTVEKNLCSNPDEIKLFKEGLTHWYTFEQGGLGTNKNTFKVIGEISQDALSWVKEGMEFDDKELIALEHPGLSIRKPMNLIRKQFIEERSVKISVKCPTCKRFH